MIGKLMKWEDLERRNHDINEVLSWILPGGQHKQEPGWPGDPFEFRTEHLPDKNLERYRYAILLGVCSVEFSLYSSNSGFREQATWKFSRKPEVRKRTHDITILALWLPSF
jgi:hypothetical protein